MKIRLAVKGILRKQCEENDTRLISVCDSNPRHVTGPRAGEDGGGGISFPPIPGCVGRKAGRANAVSGWKCDKKAEISV